MMQFHADCRGANFRPQESKNIAANLRIGDQVDLVREPENQYDENAIKVMVGNDHIGYVAKEVAASIAHWVDQNGYEMASRVSGRTNTLTPQLQIAVFEEGEDWEWEEEDTALAGEDPLAEWE